MSKTCADCKYHKCILHCFMRGTGCNGVCIKHRHLKKCYGSSCKDFKLDEYFKSY